MDSPVKILILKDEDDGDLIEYELSKSTLPFTAMRVPFSDAFLYALKEFRPDLILADINSSQLIALALAQQECPEVPFIFLSNVDT